MMAVSGSWAVAYHWKKPWRGKTKLIKMAAAAIQECLAQKTQINTEDTPLILCLSETNRPGRVFSDDNAFFLDLQKRIRSTISS